MKFEIKSRFTGCLKFIAEIECDKKEEPSVKLGLAVKWAIENFANLLGADLRNANLRGADLRGADLSGADLSGADLLVFQGLGREARTLYAHKRKTDGVIEIRTGCFFGTMDGFKEAVKKIHGDNNHAQDYLLMCKLIEQKFGV